MKAVQTQIRVIFTIIKSFVGTGIIFLPSTYKFSGIIYGNLLSGFVCILAIVALNYLVECCENDESLSIIAKRAWGNFGMALVDISIFFSQLGFATVYIIFITHSIQETVHVISNCQVELSILVLIGIQMVIYLPFAFFRHIENLGFSSTFANLSVFSVLIIIIYFGVVNIYKNPIGRPSIFYEGSIYGAGLVLGTSAFTYEGVALVLPIRNSVPHHLRSTFRIILSCTLLFIGFFSSSFSSFIYYSFGDEISSPVTGNIVNIYVRLVCLSVYSIAITFSVPLQLFPAIDIAESYILFRYKNKEIRDDRNTEDVSETINCRQFIHSSENQLEITNGESDNNKEIQLVSISHKIDHIVYSPINSPIVSLSVKGNECNCEDIIGNEAEISVQKKLVDPQIKKRFQNVKYSFIRALIAYIMILCCGLMAYGFEEELANFVAITGGLLCVPLAFVYPPLFYYKLNRKSNSNIANATIIFLVCIGCIISIVSVTMAILTWETNPRTLVCVY
ncbi:putative transmembrane amino acid transporter protein [Cryptosporidium serpentis]